jgi:hypothetical protein
MHIDTLFTKLYFYKHHRSRLDTLTYALLVNKMATIVYSRRPQYPIVSTLP